MANALNFIIGGDSTPFSNAMKTVEQVAARTSNVTVSAMRNAMAAIETAAMKELEAGRSTNTHEQAIRGLNQQIERQIALQDQLAEKTNRLALARLNVQTGASTRQESLDVLVEDMLRNPARPKDSTVLNARAPRKSEVEQYKSDFAALLSEKEATEAVAAEKKAAAAAAAKEASIARGLDKRKNHLAAVAEYEERLARKAAGAAAYQAKKINEALAAAENAAKSRALFAQHEAERAAEYKAISSEIKEVATSGVGGVGESTHGKTGFSGIVGEFLVITREIGRGNFSRVPGSVTILAQRMGVLGLVVKSTAAAAIEHAAAENKLAIQLAQVAIKTEVAAGAAASETVAARAAALAQRQRALVAKEAAEMQAAVATTSLGPLGWVASALIALGAALYFTVKHYRKLREEAENTDAYLRNSKGEYERRADALLELQDAMQKASKETEEFDNWLKKLGNTQDDIVEKTRDEIEALREKFQLMKMAAAASGQSPAQERAAEQQQRKQELEILNNRINEQKAAAEKSRQDAEIAEADFRTGHVDRATRLAELKKEKDGFKDNAKKAQELFDAFPSDIRDRLLKEKENVELIKTRGANTAEERQRVADYEKEYNAPRSFSVGGKDVSISLKAIDDYFARAERHQRRVDEQESVISKTEQQREEDLKTAKEKAETDAKNLRSLERDRDKLQRTIGLHDEFDSKLGGANHRQIPSDSLTSVGNFLGSSKNMVESLAHKQVDLLTKIEKHVSRIPKYTNSSPETEYPVS